MPPFQRGGEVHLAPFRVIRRLLELVELIKEGIDELGDLAIADVVLAPVEGDQHRADRDRIHPLARGDELRIIVMGERCGVIRVLEDFHVGNRQEFQAVAGLDPLHDRRRFACHEDGGRDLPRFQLLDGLGVAEMRFLHLDAKVVEQEMPGDRGAASRRAEIYHLALQLFDVGDIGANHDVDLFIEQL